MVLSISPSLRSACSQGLMILNALHATTRTYKLAFYHCEDSDLQCTAIAISEFALLQARGCIINVGAGENSNRGAKAENFLSQAEILTIRTAFHNYIH
jgi:hypothetical protein